MWVGIYLYMFVCMCVYVCNICRCLHHGQRTILRGVKKGCQRASSMVMRLETSYSSMLPINSNSCWCSALLLCMYCCKTPHTHTHTEG